MDAAEDSKASVLHREQALVQQEQHMSAWECMKQNPKVVLCTLYANIGSIMIGYDNLSLAVCLAMPAFQMTMAQEVNGEMTIPAYWQSAWNAMYNVMCMFGSFAAGYIQDWFGRRVTFLLTAVFAAAGIALNYTAVDSAHFLGGKIVTGFSIGLALTAGQTYVSEIAPLPMRGIALTFNTILMNLGMLIAVSSTYSRVDIMDQSAFRVLFAAAWVFPALFLVGLPFIPESPYWLVMKNRHDEAKKALRRLHSSREDLDSRFMQIVAVEEHERSLRQDAADTSYLDCFRGTNWRRTRIILICNYMPQVVGAVLSANAPYFLNQTGMASATVIMLVQIGISLGVASSVLNILFMMRFNHRALMFGGVGVCTLMYLIMGIAGCFPRTTTTLLVIGIVLQITPLSYGPAVGPSNAVAGEVSAVRLRSKSLGVGICFQYIASTVWNIVMPYLFNSTEANLGGNIGWIFFGQGLLMLVVMFYDVPGTKGRTFEELDTMFEHKLPARAFEGWESSHRVPAA
ncbi:general substrate transporter [Thozetella sp. PMI_491]|nr:general substrate transporter [Thozetella sp. PMI_491]